MSCFIYFKDHPRTQIHWSPTIKACLPLLFLLMQSSNALAMQQWHLVDESYKHGIPAWIGMVFIFLVSFAIYEKFPTITPLIGACLGGYLTYFHSQQYFCSYFRVIGFGLFTLFSLLHILVSFTTMKKDPVKQKEPKTYKLQTQNKEKEKETSYKHKQLTKKQTSKNIEKIDNFKKINFSYFLNVSSRYPKIWTTIIGAKVFHKILGEGEIIGIQKHYIYVNFVGEKEEAIFDSESFKDGVFESIKISNDQLFKFKNWTKKNKDKQDRIKKQKKRKEILLNKTLKKDIHKIIWVEIVPGSNFHSHWKSEMQIVKTNWGTYIDNITNPNVPSLQPGFDWSSVCGQTVDNVSITYSKGYEWINKIVEIENNKNNRKTWEPYDYDEEKMDDEEMEEEDGFFWGDWWPNDDFYKDN